MKHFLSTLCFALALAGGSAEKSLSLKQRNHAFSRGLNVRGGALLPSKETAVAGTLIETVNAFVMATAPKKLLELYGGESSSDLNEFLNEGGGLAGLKSAIVSWIMLNGGDKYKAIAWGITPSTYGTLASLLNGFPSKFGFPAAGQYVHLIINSVVQFALFTESKHADTIAKAYLVWSLLNGLFLAIAPSQGASVWGGGTLSDSESFSVRLLATNTIAFSILGGSLVTGSEAEEAIGRSFIPYLLNLVASTFLTGDVDNLHVSKGAAYLWMLIQAAVVTACAIPE